MPADAASCPKEPLRTGRSAALPDCRAYELVTPEHVDAAGGDLELQESLAEAIASDDGEHLALHTVTVFFEPGSHHTGTDAVFSRTASGWVMRSLAGPGMEGETFTPEVFSGDLSVTGFLARSGLVESGQLTFDVGAVGGPYTPIARGIPVGTRAAPMRTDVVGVNSGVPAIAALTDVILSSTDHELLPPGPERRAAEETNPELYDLYQSSGGRLRLVQLDSEGHLLNPCGATLGAGKVLGDAVNAVSAGGSRVFFESPSGPGEAPCFQPALYMRVDGRETVDVSEPEEGLVIPISKRGQVQFDGASPDGSRVFFTSESALTPGAGVGPYLYEYLTEAAPGSRLKLMAGEVEPPAPQGTNPSVVVSGDGSVVYYKGTGTVQVAGQPAPVFGVWRYDTASKRLSFVAAPSPILGNPQPPWYTSHDGRFLVFPAGGEGHGGEGVQFLGPHGLEVEPRGLGREQMYRYDAGDGSVMCVSCGEGVAPAVGHASTPQASLGDDSMLSIAGHIAVPVEISTDGSRVFFESSAALVPQDTNHASALEEQQSLGGKPNQGSDVYEWVAPGAEDGPGTFCHAANGCTFLLSAGESVGPEQFLGASEDGRDVFLSSAASLVPGAPSGFTSVYDARIGGGFAQHAGPVECTSCQGVGNPQPSFGMPSSATFAGAGNPPPPAAAAAAKPKPRSKPKPRCRRGYKRNRHGRCVRVTHRSGRSHR
jgi:hypothetical protein